MSSPAWFLLQNRSHDAFSISDIFHQYSSFISHHDPFSFYLSAAPLPPSSTDAATSVATGSKGLGAPAVSPERLSVIE